jgi:hypothetical protein
VGFRHPEGQQAGIGDLANLLVRQRPRALALGRPGADLRDDLRGALLQFVDTQLSAEDSSAQDRTSDREPAARTAPMAATCVRAPTDSG